MRLRPIVIVSGLLLAVPATASALTAPVVSGPTAASVRASAPKFTWAIGPEGEFVQHILVATTDRVGGSGALLDTRDGAELTFIAATATSAVVKNPIAAGRYFWTYGWSAPEAGGGTVAATFVPARALVIPAFIRKARITGFTQKATSTYLSISLSATHNASDLKIRCVVKKGARTVAVKTVTHRSQRIARANTVGCSAMTLAETLDGERLTAVVTFWAGTAKTTVTRAFVAS